MISTDIPLPLSSASTNLVADSTHAGSSFFSNLWNSSAEELIRSIGRFLPRLLIALLVCWIGWKLASLLSRSIRRLLANRKIDPSLQGFLGSLASTVLKLLVALVAMDIIGIKATSFIAIIGAAGLAVGMALQGTLQNFAGGVIILLLKPFKVGDEIVSGDYKGKVLNIYIFHTIIRPHDGRNIIVPNSDLATKSLINYSSEPYLRYSLNITISYESDIAKAKKVMMDVANGNPLVVQEPKKPSLSVVGLTDNGITITLYLWTASDNYWDFPDAIIEDLFIALRDNGIRVARPQIEIKQANK